METSVEKGFGALGGLFQSVINDLKFGMPLWEDFLAKAAKLHSQLKATILATSSFLDAFQKIADLATNTKGATKDIGTALTRIIMRHKAVEARLKTFTSSILDCLVLPLQDKMEDWKKTVTHLDKEHAKEYKKARQELKKRSSDTLRLQKKVRKGKSDIQRTLDNALQDVNDKFMVLEDTEKQAVRTALIEERSHFCLLVACLKPVVDEEVAMIGEISHLQEILEQLMKHASDPFTLPPVSEQIINDIKGSDQYWSFQTPPSSPSSLGSRKSSICSISSLNSSSSGSTKSHSPSHQLRHRSLVQQQVPVGAFRLSSISSQDSGFTSQDTLFLRPPTPPPLELARQVTSTLEMGNNSSETSSASSTPSPHYPIGPSSTATWPNLQETVHYEKTPTSTLVLADRPHTISTTYERGHQRPALTVHTFEPPTKLNHSPDDYGTNCYSADQITPTPADGISEGPPLPDRYTVLEKPAVPDKSSKKTLNDQQQYSSSKAYVPDFNQPAPNQIVPQPIYTNMDEIEAQRMSRSEFKVSTTLEQIQKQMPQQAELVAALTQGLQQRSVHRSDSEGSTSHVSLLSSSGYGSQSTVATTSDDKLAVEEFLFDRSCIDEASKYCTMPRYADHSQILAQVAGMKPYAGHPMVTSPQAAHCIGKSSTLRRSNSQTHKPPLPIRRTSSITSQHGLTVVALRNQQAGAATLPRASSGTIEGLGKSQQRQLSDNSLDNLMARKSSFDNQEHHFKKESFENHLSLIKSNNLGKQREIKEEVIPPPPPEEPPSTGQPTVGKVANTIKELEEQATIKTNTNTALQEHIVAKINSMVVVEQNHKRKQNQATNGIANYNGVRKSSVSSQSSSQSEGEIATEATKTDGFGSRPSSPRTGAHRPGTPRTTTSSTTATHHSGTSSTGSPRTNSPRMGSLARRMSEPGRFQSNDENNIAANRANLIQSLNAKLLMQQDQQQSNMPPATLPKPPRAQSENNQHDSFLSDLNAKLAQHVQKQTVTVPAVHNQPAPANEKQSFKESLNAKLAQQCGLENSDAGRVLSRRASVGDAATRVRQWMASRPSVDPATCRESLLDQIRRGASLRRASTNDRSGPRIQ